MILFCDRDLGRAIPDALEAAGRQVVRHDDIFSPTTLDTEWLRYAGENGLVALTHNRKIGQVAIERDMAMRAGVRLVFLIGGMPHPLLALNLVSTLPKLDRFIAKHPPPFIARLYRPDPPRVIGQHPGRVDMALTLAQWSALPGVVR